MTRKEEHQTNDPNDALHPRLDKSTRQPRRRHHHFQKRYALGIFRLSKKTKDQIVLALRTRIKSLRELREFLHNKTNELEIEERALVEKVNEEKKLRREKKDDGDRKKEQRESKE